jgi:hypothetical protein
VSHRLRTVRVVTVLFCLLIITAKRDGYIQFATVISRAILRILELRWLANGKLTERIRATGMPTSEHMLIPDVKVTFEAKTDPGGGRRIVVIDWRSGVFYP